MTRFLLCCPAAVLATLLSVSTAWAACDVTKAPDPPFVPPPPYHQTVKGTVFWYGTPALWTSLYPGAWTAGQVQKMEWWRQGYDWHTGKPHLIVTAQRVDRQAKEITLEANPEPAGTKNPGIVTAFRTPPPGCWKITGRYDETALSFVVEVKP